MNREAFNRTGAFQELTQECLNYLNSSSKYLLKFENTCSATPSSRCCCHLQMKKMICYYQRGSRVQFEQKYHSVYSLTCAHIVNV